MNFLSLILTTLGKPLLKQSPKKTFLVHLDCSTIYLNLLSVHLLLTRSVQELYNIVYKFTTQTHCHTKGPQPGHYKYKLYHCVFHRHEHCKIHYAPSLAYMLILDLNHDIPCHKHWKMRQIIFFTDNSCLRTISLFFTGTITDQKYKSYSSLINAIT